jgi:hypothetical protein
MILKAARLSSATFISIASISFLISTSTLFEAKMPSKYADAHKSTNGPGNARPTALQIIQDQGLGGKLTGKVFLIIGCSSDMGVATAKALATTGATLYLTALNIPAAQKALESILKSGQVELIDMNLSSL